MNSNNDITMVVTSCNRPIELYKTLESFFKYNTHPIQKIIIIDDSGIKTCIDNCIDLIPSNIEKKIIYNDTNIGQIKSIDIAYSFVETEYIFHCEDDWEFYDYGFIEKSLEILQDNDRICCVWLREYRNGILCNNGHPIIMDIINDKYRFVDDNYLNQWMGFSFNPGLRKLSDYNSIGNYCQYNNTDKYGGNCEINLQNEYKIRNKIVAITLNENGYVRHIGWHNPVRH
jgi:hypothetical protein